MSRRNLSLLLLAPLLLASCGTAPVASTTGASTETPPQAERRWFSTKPALRVDDMQITAMQEHNDGFTVRANVASDGPGIVLRVEGREYPLQSVDGTGYTFASVTVPKLGANNAKLIVDADDASPNTASFTITREMRTIDEYRKYAEPLNYKQLSKNADKFAGRFVKGRGRIYQIDEETDGAETITTGGLNVTHQGYGYWDDNVRFMMAGENDFVEDDIVSFYGVVLGDYTYESQAGWNITVPMVQLAFMEK